MANKKLNLSIAYLYSKSMNIYGDRGNIFAIQYRCHKRGINTNIDTIEVGEPFDQTKYDFVFSGGGQDVHQLRIADDLIEKKEQIQIAVDRGVVFLLICGTYQLFGHYFKTHEQTCINGIGILDIHTIANKKRKIGNVIIQLSPEIVKHTTPKLKPTTLVGFENHSGNTYLNTNNTNTTHPIGTLIHGFGNNGEDKYEGARYKNVFGTYFHGSLLPKNPHFCDYLIKLALENKYKRKINLTKMDNSLELKAHEYILKNRTK